MGENILVPYDGSAAAREALEYAIDRFDTAEFTILYVMDPMVDYGRQRALPGYSDADEFTTEREKAEYLLEEALADLPVELDVESSLSVGNPSRAIIKHADDRDIDHIVIGSHGRSGIARFLLGSTAETVLRRSAVPVTVIRPTD